MIISGHQGYIGRFGSGGQFHWNNQTRWDGMGGPKGILPAQSSVSDGTYEMFLDDNPPLTPPLRRDTPPFRSFRYLTPAQQIAKDRRGSGLYGRLHDIKADSEPLFWSRILPDWSAAPHDRAKYHGAPVHMHLQTWLDLADLIDVIRSGETVPPFNWRSRPIPSGHMYRSFRNDIAAAYERWWCPVFYIKLDKTADGWSTTGDYEAAFNDALNELKTADVKDGTNEELDPLGYWGEVEPGGVDVGGDWATARFHGIVGYLTETVVHAWAHEERTYIDIVGFKDSLPKEGRFIVYLLLSKRESEGVHQNADDWGNLHEVQLFSCSGPNYDDVDFGAGAIGSISNTNLIEDGLYSIELPGFEASEEGHDNFYCFVTAKDRLGRSGGEYVGDVPTTLDVNMYEGQSFLIIGAFAYVDEAEDVEGG